VLVTAHPVIIFHDLTEEANGCYLRIETEGGECVVAVETNAPSVGLFPFGLRRRCPLLALSGHSETASQRPKQVGT
jgi:hypothetical protein